jgi:hypothetical protein
LSDPYYANSTNQIRIVLRFATFNERANSN